MDRRGFLGSILALGAAPAIVRADSLMRIVPRDLVIVTEVGPLNISGNRLMTIDEITREALRICHEKAQFIRTVNRQYDAKYAQEDKDDFDSALREVALETASELRVIGRRYFP